MTTQQTSHPAGAWLPLPDAATALGVSLETIRRRVKREEIQTRKVPMKTGFKYEVWIENSLTGQATSQLTDQTPRHSPSQDLQPLYQLLANQQAEISRLGLENSRLHDERAEIYGRLGFLQSQNQQLQERLQQSQALLQQSEEELRLLKAPPAAAELEPAEAVEVKADPEPTPAPEQSRSWWHRLLFG